MCVCVFVECPYCGKTRTRTVARIWLEQRAKGNIDRNKPALTPARPRKLTVMAESCAYRHTEIFSYRNSCYCCCHVYEQLCIQTYGNMTRQRAEQYGVRIPTGEKYFSFLRDVLTGSGSSPTGGGSIQQGKSGRDVNFTTHLHVVPKLRLSGAIPPPSPYAFTGCPETPLPSPQIISQVILLPLSLHLRTLSAARTVHF